MRKNSAYTPSDAAREASDYFNSLPFGEREKLAPLLDHYRQMGLAEAVGHLRRATLHINTRISGIHRAAPPNKRKD